MDAIDEGTGRIVRPSQMAYVPLMNRFGILCVAALLVACGDDGGAAGDASTGAGTTGTTDAPTSGTPTTESPTTDAPTTDSPTTDAPTTDSPTTDGSSSGGADSTGAESSSGGESLDCDAIPAGPFAPEEVFMPAAFDGSEDLAFDGAGGLAGKNGGNVRVVDASGAEVGSYVDAGLAYGLRYRANGDLLVAHPQSGVIRAIAPDGSGSDFATGVGGVNGIYPDLDDNVWITYSSVVGRYAADGSYTDIVTGGDAATANGIVYDGDRGVAFYTNYSQGRIRKVIINDDGSAGAISDVAQVNGAAMDGLSLDACGNIYAVDQGNSRLYRVMLDAAGDPLGNAEDIVEGNIQNIANAQFGRGGDFDELSIYAAGIPGVVYRFEVGVPGAEIPLP